MSNFLLGHTSYASDPVLAEVNSHAAVEFSGPGSRQTWRFMICAHLHPCTCTECDSTFPAPAERPWVGMAGCGGAGRARWGSSQGICQSHAWIKLLLPVLGFCEYFWVIHKLRVGRRRNLNEIACFQFFVVVACCISFVCTNTWNVKGELAHFQYNALFRNCLYIHGVW